MTVCAIVLAMTAATLIGVAAIRKIGSTSSDQILRLLCETGQKNLDSYFDSVEQSVETVSAFAEADLEGLTMEQFPAHVDRIRDVFEKMARQTHGVLTYYYRIDPAFSATEKGFWYVDLDGEGFVEHEATDITLYDTADTSRLVWFTVPKFTGRAIWLPPYVTDNLDVLVISYNVPITWDGAFVGVVGIEIDYSTMAEQVDHIELYDSGYAFINDAEGNIIYHPFIDVADIAGGNGPTVPEGLLSESASIRYTFDGVEKQAVWLPLENGMRLNVTVPISEINGNWKSLIREILVASLVLLAVASFAAAKFAGNITKPLRELTEVAEEVDRGNYDVALDYNGDDDVGILARTVNKLAANLKVYIGELNSLAYADALTSVRNKGAFDIHVRQLQADLDESGGGLDFAVGVFDCDDLKAVNDQNGHDKGDIYLKTTSKLICQVFKHSPVFRIGGDEFAMILQNDDFRNREALIQSFREQSAAICASADSQWEQVRVALGVAVYDPERDTSVNDVVRRADQLMYENKRSRKEGH